MTTKVLENSLPYVDVNAMSAAATISTAAVDRVGDSLIPTGVVLDNYRLNPVVLWNHGFAPDSTPIGRCEHEDGSLAIEVTDKAVIGTCYFSQHSRDSEQIFGLVADKIIRATSVRENPIDWSTVERNGRWITLIRIWELIEWSWVDVGCNPEAVAKLVGDRRIRGKAITPYVMKSLQSIASRPTEAAKHITDLRKDFTDIQQAMREIRLERAQPRLNAIREVEQNLRDVQKGCALKGLLTAERQLQFRKSLMACAQMRGRILRECEA